MLLVGRVSLEMCACNNIIRDTCPQGQRSCMIARVLNCCMYVRSIVARMYMIPTACISSALFIPLQGPLCYPGTLLSEHRTYARSGSASGTKVRYIRIHAYVWYTPVLGKHLDGAGIWLQRKASHCQPTSHIKQGGCMMLEMYYVVDTTRLYYIDAKFY